MADVRAMLKNERAARRIQHKYASYSTTGSLLCIVCRLQLKSESLWAGHIKSAGHVMKAQKLEEEKEQAAEAEADVQEVQPQPPAQAETGNKKRKIDEDDEDESARKRTRPTNGASKPTLSATQAQTDARPPVRRSPTDEFQIPSRPATPLKTNQETPKRLNVDETEWAAFEADIAATKVPEVNNDAVISAPAMTAAELARKSTEESNLQRSARIAADLEGEKEDAARKLEEQLEEQESLEQRVKRLREKREELRRKESVVQLKQIPTDIPTQPIPAAEEEEGSEDEDDDDEWDGFRMR